MRYMGGKFRQSKAIVEVLRPYVTPDTVYVEPFCGGMWSAARVARELHPRRMILNDANECLVTFWNYCISNGTSHLPTDLEVIENNYQTYKHTKDPKDPLTAWYGFECSFGGRYFEGVARNKHTTKSTDEKINCIRAIPHEITFNSYELVNIPDGSVVYCDPPYERPVKRVKQLMGFKTDEFWQWVRDLSKRCIVFTSCFDCPNDFKTVYEWGDTVVRHWNSRGTDGINERLVKYAGV